MTLTGYEGDALKLAASNILAAGTKPGDTYKAGSWDTVPSTDTAFVDGFAVTYTYTYEKVTPQPTPDPTQAPIYVPASTPTSTPTPLPYTETKSVFNPDGSKTNIRYQKAFIN